MKDTTHKQFRKQIDKFYEMKSERVVEYVKDMEEIDQKIARVQSKCPHIHQKTNTFLYDHSVVCTDCDKVLEEKFGVFIEKEKKDGPLETK